MQTFEELFAKQMQLLNEQENKQENEQESTKNQTQNTLNQDKTNEILQNEPQIQMRLTQEQNNAQNPILNQKLDNITQNISDETKELLNSVKNTSNKQEQNAQEPQNQNKTIEILQNETQTQNEPQEQTQNPQKIRSLDEISLNTSDLNENELKSLYNHAVLINKHNSGLVSNDSLNPFNWQWKKQEQFMSYDEFKKLYRQNNKNDVFLGLSKEQTGAFMEENDELTPAFIEAYNKEQKRTFFSNDTFKNPELFLKKQKDKIKKDIVYSANKYKAELKSLNSYYSDLLYLFKDPTQKEQLDALKIEKEIDLKLKDLIAENFGLTLQKNDEGEYRAFDKKMGIAIELDDLDSFLADLGASKFETSGAIAGALTGAVLAPDPVTKTGAAIIGGAIGAYLGTGIDTFFALKNTNQELKKEIFLKKMNDSATGSLVFDIATLGAGKVLKKPVAWTIKHMPTGFVVRKAKQIVTTENLPLAQKFFDEKGIDDNFLKVRKLHEKYDTDILAKHNTPSINTLQDYLSDKLENYEKTNAQKDLLTKALATQDGVSLLLEIAAEHPQTKRHLINQVEKINKQIANQIQRSDLGVDEMIDLAQNYQKRVINNYSTFVDTAKDLAQKYNVNLPTQKIYDDLNVLIEQKTALSTTLNKDKKTIKRFLKDTFFYDDKMRENLSFNDLNEIRKSLSYLYENLNTHSGKELSKQFKAIIDENISTILNELEQKAGIKNINKSFFALKQDYHFMKKNWDNRFFNDLNENVLKNSGINKEKVIKKHIDAIKNSTKDENGNFVNNSLNDYLNFFSEKDKAKYEMSLIKEIINSHKINIDNTGFSTTLYDKTNILNALENVKFVSREANDTIDLIKDIQTLFNDDKLFASKIHLIAEKMPSQGIGQNTISRGKTMFANFKMEMLKKYLPIAKTPAVKYHLKRALLKSTNFNEVKTNLLKDINSLKTTPLISEQILKEFYNDLQNAEHYLKNINHLSEKDIKNISLPSKTLDLNIVKSAENEVFYIDEQAVLKTKSGAIIDTSKSPLLKGVIVAEKQFNDYLKSLSEILKVTGQHYQIGKVFGLRLFALALRDDTINIYVDDEPIFKEKSPKDITLDRIERKILNLGLNQIKIKNNESIKNTDFDKKLRQKLKLSSFTGGLVKIGVINHNLVYAKLVNDDNFDILVKQKGDFKIKATNVKGHLINSDFLNKIF